MNDSPQDAERQLVSHNIDHFGSTAVRLKPVRVAPEFVRSRSLHVDENIGRVLLEDLGPPMNRDAMQSQTVTNLRAFGNCARVHRENSEAQPRRGDLFQVAGVGKEREYFVDRTRNPSSSPQPVKIDAYIASSPALEVALPCRTAGRPTR